MLHVTAAQLVGKGPGQLFAQVIATNKEDAFLFQLLYDRRGIDRRDHSCTERNSLMSKAKRFARGASRPCTCPSSSELSDSLSGIAPRSGPGPRPLRTGCKDAPSHARAVTDASHPMRVSPLSGRRCREEVGTGEER